MTAIDESLPKAIETFYDKHRFRSRLEAKWAVFLKAVGYDDYQYEERGFDLGENGWYLPDFYIPELRSWIEVKGVMKFEDSKTIVAFARSQPEPIIVVGDVPMPRSYGPHFHVIGKQRRSDVVALHQATWAATERGALPEQHGIPQYFTPGYIPAYDDIWKFNSPPVLSMFPAIEDAYETARFARFEHGETPDLENMIAFPRSGEWLKPTSSLMTCHFRGSKDVSLCRRSRRELEMKPETDEITRCYECEVALIKLENRPAALPGQRSAKRLTW